MSTLMLELPNTIRRERDALARKAGISSDEYARRAIERSISAEAQLEYLRLLSRGDDPDAVP